MRQRQEQNAGVCIETLRFGRLTNIIEVQIKCPKRREWQRLADTAVEKMRDANDETDFYARLTAT